MQTFDYEEILNVLTIREKTILVFILDGLTSKEIARELICSESTVKKHREHILQKAQVKGVTAIRRFLTGLRPYLP